MPVTAEVDLTVEEIEKSISVLERTIKNTEQSRGPVLKAALQKQLAARRNQLSVFHLRARSKSESRASVIVHTSTPDTSISLGNIFFDEGLEILNPDDSNQPPAENFQIFLDPEIENTPPTPEARPSSLSRPPLIEIVETPTTAFNNDNTQPRFVFENLDENFNKNLANAKMSILEEQDIPENMRVLMINLKKAVAKLETLFDCYDPKNYPVNILRTNKEGWMKKVDEVMTSVTEACLEFQFLDDVPEVSDAECKDILKGAKTKFIKFINDFNTKILGELNIGDNDVGRADSVSSRGGQSTDSEKEAEAARVAEIDVDIDHEKISKDVKDLSAELNKFEDWSKVEPHEIEIAMHKIEGWQKRAKLIQDSVFKMKRNILKFKLDDSKLRAAENAVNYMQSELENIIEVIQFEDDTRCLYSLNKERSAKVAYPSFSGKLEEDFDKFKKDMNAALKTNQIKRSDQVKVIRENISGKPKSMISPNLDDIDKAWRILSEIYGGAGRLVKSKKSKLTAMGSMPKPDSKLPGHVRQRVKWLLEIDLVLKDLSELAKTNMECYCEIFNDSTLKTIKSFFPLIIHKKMSGFQGSSKDRFGQISALVEKLLKDDRRLLADVDDDGSGTNVNMTRGPQSHLAAGSPRTSCPPRVGQGPGSPRTRCPPWVRPGPGSPRPSITQCHLIK